MLGTRYEDDTAIPFGELLADDIAAFHSPSRWPNPARNEHPALASPDLSVQPWACGQPGGWGVPLHCDDANCGLVCEETREIIGIAGQDHAVR